MKLEILDLNKFIPFKIEKSFDILGGASTQQPGGCSCATGAGSNSNGQAWTSDTNEYDRNGNLATTDYHGATGFVPVDPKGYTSVGGM